MKYASLKNSFDKKSVLRRIEKRLGIAFDPISGRGMKVDSEPTLPLALRSRGYA
jgi:hypothetical protein